MFVLYMKSLESLLNSDYTQRNCACIADSIKVALGIGKLLFGGHSSKSLHCSICPNAQCPIQPIKSYQSNLF